MRSASVTEEKGVIATIYKGKRKRGEGLRKRGMRRGKIAKGHRTDEST